MMTVVRNTSNMTLTWDAADAITVQNLQECLERLKQENDVLLQSTLVTGDLPAHKKEDYDHNVLIMAHLVPVIKYFGG